jgi:hypothetical protein
MERVTLEMEQMYVACSTYVNSITLIRSTVGAGIAQWATQAG